MIAPVASGVLSALGLAVSERRRDLQESVLLSGERAARATAVAEVVARLADRGREELGDAEAEVRATYELRYAGQAFELPIEGATEPEPADLRAAFDRAHADRYGYEDPDAQLELVTVRVAVALPGGRAAARPRASPRERRGGGAPGSGAGGSTPPCSAPAPASRRARPSSSCRARRWWCRPGWSARADAETVVMER